MEKKLRIVFMGTPAFAVSILEAIYRTSHEIVGVVTAADKPAGRGQLIHESAVKQFAIEHKLKCLQPLLLKDESFIKELKDFNADLFIVVAFRMLPEVVWKIPEMGTINLHASLLPKYRGAAPINWVIINGEKETGVSTFFINEEIDTGAVIQQRKISIHEEMTAGELQDALMKLGSQLTVETIEQIARGENSSTPQNDADSTHFLAPKIYKADCEINWTKSAIDIHNHIRGLSPYPAAWCKLWSKKKNQWISFKLFESQLLQACSPVRLDGPFLSKQGIIFPTNGGFIVIGAIQAEGKKRLDFKSFSAGNDLNDLFFNA